MSLARLLLLFTLAAAPVCAETIEVPLDHFEEGSPKIELEFALAAPFDPDRPTVIVTADAQQFYVRADRMERIREQSLGEEFNVVGILGRGTSPAASAACREAEGAVDWHCAFRIFRAEQWVEDIDAVRRELVGEHGKIHLFGQSGGALLVHQYLGIHGHHVARAITPAAVNPYLESSLGLAADHFWKELGAESTELQQLALRAAERFNDQREDLMAVLQRQNFFHGADEIGAARRDLISRLARGDQKAFDTAKTDYQVDAVNRLMDSARGISIRVRLWEFYAPSRIESSLNRPGIHPGSEVIRNDVLPLIRANHSRAIDVWPWDAQRLRDVEAEILVLAGRFDHTVDYRASIALAHVYPQGTLLIVRDNHTFDDMKASGSYRKLIRSFLGGGMESEDYRALMKDIQEFIWRE